MPDKALECRSIWLNMHLGPKYPYPLVYRLVISIYSAIPSGLNTARLLQTLMAAFGGKKL